MASPITASGGSIDVQSIVSQLMQVEQQPLTKLQSALSGIKTQVSAFASLKSQLSALQDAARGLTNTTLWQASTATSSNESIVKATGTGGGAKGTMSVVVQQLAQAQSAVSGQFASAGAVVGGGTLSIQLGTASGGGFTADGARPAVSISIPSNATLADVRNAINDSNAGVSATLVNDGGQVRLMLRSTDTGAANAFSMQVSGAEMPGGGGLEALAYTPGTAGAMTAAQSAQDAKYTLDGLALSSASNTVSNAVDGVTLQLNQVSAAPVSVQVGADNQAMRAAVDAFVTAYNALSTNISKMTSYDATSKTAGTLQGNYIVVQLQSQMRSLLSGVVGGSGLSRLSNAGIELQRDGTLKVNDTKFSAAAADPAQLKALFSAADPANPNGGGIARRFNSLITQVLGTDGSITTALDSLNSRTTANQRQQDAINSRLASTQARLTRLYTQLDANLSSMQALSASLTSQLSGLDNNTIPYK